MNVPIRKHFGVSKSNFEIFEIIVLHFNATDSKNNYASDSSSLRFAAGMAELDI